MICMECNKKFIIIVEKMAKIMVKIINIKQDNWEISLDGKDH